MAFARSFSKHFQRAEFQVDIPSRSNSAATRKRIQMADISLPVNLLSSTNDLAYDAPDIAKIRTRGLSDLSTSSKDSNDEPGLTDGSSAGSSPTAERNHLSCYFPPMPPNKRTQSSPDVSVNRPAIPRRAPSHSKREHERLARTRSLRGSLTGSSPSASPSTTPLLDASAVFGPDAPHVSIPTVNALGSQLGQLSEVAEEVHQVARSAENEQDLAHMKVHGLAIHKPSEYVSMIWPSGPFDLDMPPEGGFI